MNDDIVTRLGFLTNNDQPGYVRSIAGDAVAEIERLRRWKAEALQVADEWEKVAAAVPVRPEDLGRWKQHIVLDEIERLRFVEERARLVARALTVEGDHPPHHRRMVAGLRRTWPVLAGAIDNLDVALRTKVRQQRGHHHPPSSVSGRAVDVFTIDRAMTPRQIEDFKAAWDAIPRPSEQVTQEPTDNDRSEQ